MRLTWTTAIILGSGLTLDLLSFITWSVPSWLGLMAVTVVAIVAFLTFIDIRLGVAAVLLELLWGSHGYLLSIPWRGLNISLRMGIFFVVLAATVWHLRQRSVRAALWQVLRDHPVRWPALAFLSMLALGFILGLLRHPFDRVFFDANAWAFLALGPTFLLAASPGKHPAFVRESPQAMQNAKCKMQQCCPESFCILHSAFIILVGALYLIFRTYFFLFAFTHDLGGAWLPLYQWVRDTRLGEVTIFSGAFPRVFLPSMVLLFPAMLLAAHHFRTSRMSPYHTVRPFSIIPVHRMVALIVFGGGVTVLLMSLSRSYWLAGGVLIILGIIWSAVQIMRPKVHSHFRTKVRMNAVQYIALFSSVVIGIAVAVMIVRLPYPKPLTTAGVGETLLTRLSADVAVSNRWQQVGPLWEAIRTHIVFGNGYGAAVVYETKDPRTLASFPSGRYTTTAFEWGYLDDFLERGLIGLIAEMWLLAALIWCSLRNRRCADDEQIRGYVEISETQKALAFGFLGIVIIHATSPYLNHPLGIGLMLWLFAMVQPKQGVLSSN